MNAPWSEVRCVFCGQPGVTREHLIPEALGGRLTCNFLCKPCNSRLGHDLEASAKLDHSILSAANSLQEAIPAISASIVESHRFVGIGKSGKQPGQIKKGAFTVFSRKLDDGSLIQSTERARETIRTTLEREGVEEISILEALTKYDEAAPDTMIEITPQLMVAKWTTEDVEPDLSHVELMNPLLPAKIAFEFFALIVDKSIYSSHVGLLETKSCFQTMSIQNEVIKVERFVAREAKPFHGIYFEGSNPYMKIQVRLFGLLAFVVHFPLIELNAPKLIYTHYLDTNKEHLKTIEN